LILADVNVLIYAFRGESPLHGPCKAWLAAVVSGDARFGVSPLALSALARITTDRRIFAQPSSIEDAFGFCDDILNQPHCEIIEPGERHWPIFKRLCDETGIRGRGITDVWYAALAIEHGCVWITYDRGFARFPELAWREPAV
jgi:toxin-antitoxin system PIN domain toxin